MYQLESMPMPMPLPTLLRNSGMHALGRELTEGIKVKNTFIDGFDSDSDDDDMAGLPVMTKVKTCPAKVLLPLSPLGSQPELEQQPESSPTSRSAQRPSTVPATTPEPAQPTVVIEPLESRQPRPSRG